MGARGCGRDAVLAGPGFGNHSRLAHPQRQQGLAQRVVDLVGAGVVDVLAFEPDLGSAAALAQPPGVIQRRGATDEVAQQLVQVGLEGRIAPGRLVFGGQLVQGPRQGLRHIPPAKTAESPGRVGDLCRRPRNCRSLVCHAKSPGTTKWKVRSRLSFAGAGWSRRRQRYVQGFIGTEHGPPREMPLHSLPILAPSPAASSRFSAKRRSRPRKPSTSPNATLCSSDSGPSSSCTPSARVVTIGRPAAMASSRTFGIPSQREGKISISDARRTCGTWGLQPAKWTRPSNRMARTRDSS